MNPVRWRFAQDLALVWVGLLAGTAVLLLALDGAELAGLGLSWDAWLSHTLVRLPRRLADLSPLLAATSTALVCGWWTRTRRWIALSVCGRFVSSLAPVALGVGLGFTGLCLLVQEAVAPAAAERAAASGVWVQDGSTWLFARHLLDDRAEDVVVVRLEDEAVVAAAHVGRMHHQDRWVLTEVRELAFAPFDLDEALPVPSRWRSLGGTSGLQTDWGTARKASWMPAWLADRLLLWLGAGVFSVAGLRVCVSGVRAGVAVVSVAAVWRLVSVGLFSACALGIGSLTSAAILSFCLLVTATGLFLRGLYRR